MRTDSRVILILGLGDDDEANVVQTLVTDHDILLLESPLETICHATLESFPHVDFSGALAVQRVGAADAGALQRVADAVAARHGRLDWLVLGSRLALPGLPGNSPWHRFTRPYHFGRLAAVMTCLPLLESASAARIIDLCPQDPSSQGLSPQVLSLQDLSSQKEEGELYPLLAGTSIRHERLLLAEAGVNRRKTAFKTASA